MRILNICAYTWAIGGPARIIFDHTTAALKAGHEVDILSPAAANDAIYPVPAGARVVVCLRTEPVSRFFPEFSLELWDFLKKNSQNYDIIHCHGIWHFGSIAPFLIKNSPAKVITIHGLLDKWALAQGYWKKQIFGWLFQKRFLRQAALIQINNRDERTDLRQFLGFEHPNVKIIPNGMHLAELMDLPPKGGFRAVHNLPASVQIVLFMGRLHIKKGLDLLLPAFAKYAQNHPDVVLVLAGPDDGYQAEAERFIAQNKLETKILLVGMLTDNAKKEALADATLFALPSYSEGFSIAALEAMAAGVPALVSDRIGFDGTVAQHKAAHEVALTVDSVHEGLQKILKSLDYQREIAQNAQKMVRNLYDIDVVAANLLNEFMKIVPHKPQ